MELASRETWDIGALIVIGLFVIMGLLCGRVGATPDPGWSIEIVDNEENIASVGSIALGNDNYPHISYYSFANRDLKYAKFTGKAWSTETVDSVGDVGGFSSMALDPSGYPHISYYDFTNHDLKYARWSGSAWSIETVDSTGDVGMETSIALDENGRPHISYSDHDNEDLKYVHWVGGAWSIETVDSEGYVGHNTSIALDSSGYPHISYYDVFNGDLKCAHSSGDMWIIETVDSTGDVGLDTSIALDENGRPHISYRDFTNLSLKYARWTGSTWSIETIDSTGNVGHYTSIALNESGYPHISYRDYTNEDLKYAHWTGSMWDIETVDSAGLVGVHTSIALDSSGYPHISYLDFTTNWYLKYAHRINSIPALSYNTVVPSVSPAGMTFTYYSIYTDADSDPPAYIRVCIDNAPYEMTEDDLTDDDLTDGKMYKYEWATTLTDIGSHTYYFEASDGFDNVRVPTENDSTGPTVEKLLTTLTVSPSSFVIKTGDSKSLTATLTTGEVPLQNKPIFWSASEGSVAPTSSYTDAQGNVIVAYTAPDNETTVTVTASFVEDSTYQASSDSGVGTVAQFVAMLTFSTPDGAPCSNQKIYFRFADDETDNYFGTTDDQGQIILTNGNFAGKQVHFKSEDDKYAGTAYISSAGGEVAVVISPGFEISAGTIVAVAVVVVIVALIVMYAKGKKWWEKTEGKIPEIPPIK